jgi:cytochrome c-type biogenesis protein CcmH
VKKLALWVLLGTLVAAASWAVDSEPPLGDPQLQARYEALIREVRCLVCQNQTIADSGAPLAGDLRREIREMVAKGASEKEVTDFLVARYGDFVLYRPPVEPKTWALWGAPAALVAIGLFVFARVLRTRTRQPVGPSEEDA